MSKTGAIQSGGRKGKANPTERTPREPESLSSETSYLEVYLTTQRWEKLYPHTYGEQLLKEILESSGK